MLNMNNFEQLINYIRDIFRKEGITGMDSIKHSIFFILSKFLNEEKCKIFDIPIKYSFDKIRLDDNNVLLDYNLLMEKIYNKTINCLVGQIYKKLNFKLDFKLEDYNNINLIFNKLKDINIDDLNLDFDIIGTIYELHLKTGSSQSMRDLGQYYTNRYLINYMISLCNPKLNETILDPSCGTGGFLTMSIKYLNNNHNDINWNINKKNIYGFDIDENVKNMTLLNLLLETGELFEDNIIKRDTLKNDILLKKIDIILANEPFGLKNILYNDCCDKIKNLKIKGTKGEPLFLQLMMESLNINGKCAVIVPEGILFNESNLYLETRKYLIENLNLIKIIYMNDSFFMNTNVKCAILFFKNNGKTKKVNYTEIKLDNNNIIEKEIIKIKYNEIIKNNYYLEINKYIKNEIKIENIKYEKLNNICEIIKGNKINSKEGKETGLYPLYYCSILGNLYLDTFDYEEEGIIINKTNGSGKCMVYLGNGKYNVGETTIHFKSLSNNLTKYIYYYLLKNRNLIENKFKGSNQKSLTENDLFSIEIPIPSLEIQQKIINILDIYYNQIDNNNKSIHNYNLIKKYLIELNTINCKNIKLEDILIVKQGDYITKKDIIEGIYGVYGGGNASFFINKYNNENTLIISKDGVSKNCIRWVNDKFFVNHHAWTIKLLNDNYYEKYIYYILWVNELKIYNLAAGSAQKGINQKNFLNLEIPIPSKEIQNDIIKQCEYYDNQIEILKNENKVLINNDIIKTFLTKNLLYCIQ